MEEFHDALEKFSSPLYSAILEDVTNAAKSLDLVSISFNFSPLWIQLLLMTISFGATGKTLIELDKSSYFKQSVMEKKKILTSFMGNLSYSNNDTSLEIMNMMFLSKNLSINKTYEQFVKNIFNMTIDYIDFQYIKNATDLINKKIADRTIRKMKQSFDETDLNENASIVVFSSVYFRSRWLYPPTVMNDTSEFKVNTTGPHAKIKMYRINGMMLYANIPKWDAQVVEIPYVTKGITMLLFLPNSVNGLLNMEYLFLEKSYLLKYTQKVMNNTPVAVTLPRFVVETNVLLPSKLRKVGIDRIFSNEAELEGIVQKNGIPISNAVQRIKFWGTEGRGAFKDTGDEELPHPEKILIADRPFAFVIKMNNTVFLFGQFLNQ